MAPHIEDKTEKRFDPSEHARRGFRATAPAVTRFLLIIPVIALLIGAATLSVVGGVETFKTVMHVVQGEYGEKEALVAFIELADLFLLGVVLYIISIGLYELFIDDKLALPKWLEFHDIDDLKHRLASVVVVVLAVMFLGSSIQTKEPMDILLRGAGTGLVILPLAYFLKGSHGSGGDGH